MLAVEPDERGGEERQEQRGGGDREMGRRDSRADDRGERGGDRGGGRVDRDRGGGGDREMGRRDSRADDRGGGERGSGGERGGGGDRGGGDRGGGGDREMGRRDSRADEIQREIRLAENAGLVIGRQGVTIMGFERETGARLRVDQATKTLMMSGTPEEVEHATGLVNDLLAGANNNRFSWITHAVPASCI